MILPLLGLIVTPLPITNTRPARPQVDPAPASEAVTLSLRIQTPSSPSTTRLQCTPGLRFRRTIGPSSHSHGACPRSESANQLERCAIYQRATTPHTTTTGGGHKPLSGRGRLPAMTAGVRTSCGMFLPLLEGHSPKENPVIRSTSDCYTLVRCTS
ncbi:hypothetical protein C8Q77DRAFT_221493 [Trametes polyzona]|nr:hypothetical protein C8Q77DRAFT_221493 [Trametes polyzona]